MVEMVGSEDGGGGGVGSKTVEQEELVSLCKF